jgi:hypothetical protein
VGRGPLGGTAGPRGGCGLLGGCWSSGARVVCMRDICFEGNMGAR